MFRHLLIALLLVSSLLIACGETDDSKSAKVDLARLPDFENFKAGELLDVKGKLEPAIAYSLYLPSGYRNTKKIPLIVLMDAHSRTHTSVKQYISVCEKLHVAMICSGTSRNGLELNSTNLIAQKTLDDVTSRVHVDSAKLYLAGFSGGAKVSAAAALNDNRVKGLIACAAPFDRTADIPCVLIAGLTDINASDLYLLSQSLQSPHGFLTFDGIHTWPPDSVMQRAIGALLNNSVAKLTDSKKINSIFTKQILDNENYQKQQLQQMFQNNNWDELLIRINTMKALIQTETRPDAKALQQRLLATCGMYCFFTVPKAHEMSKALQVYEAADPMNPDMWFFKAVYVGANNKMLAKQYLSKAASLGFYDQERLNAEPALVGIADESILKAIKDNN